MAEKLEVVLGCNYPPNDTRAEVGDIITVPDPVAKQLIAAGAAKPYVKPAAPVPAPPKPAPPTVPGGEHQ